MDSEFNWKNFLGAIDLLCYFAVWVVFAPLAIGYAVSCVGTLGKEGALETGAAFVFFWIWFRGLSWRTLREEK